MGNKEYVRAAKETYAAIFEKVAASREGCPGDHEDHEEIARGLLDPNASASERKMAVALDYGCMRIKVNEEIIRKLTPGTVDIILQFGMPIIGSLRLGTYATSLLRILEGVEDIRELSSLSSIDQEVIQSLKEAMQWSKMLSYRLPPNGSPWAAAWLLGIADLPLVSTVVPVREVETTANENCTSSPRVDQGNQPTGSEWA